MPRCSVRVGGAKTEQELGAGVVQRGEFHFIEYEEVVAQEGVDGLADGVVGQSPVPGMISDAADTQTTTRHPIGAGDSTVTCTPARGIKEQLRTLLSCGPLREAHEEKMRLEY